MNQRILNRCVEVARALKPKVIEGGTRFHASFAIKKSAIAAIGVNDYNKLHPYHKFGKYKNYKGFETEYVASIHSECALAVKMGVTDWSDFEIVNIRVGSKGNIMMSAACANCAKSIIAPLNPRRVYYSTNEGKFELDERF